MTHDAGNATRTISWHVETPAAWQTITPKVEALARAVSTRLASRDPAWLGHLKILVQAGTQAAYVSVTAADEQPHWNGIITLPNTQFDITIYAVIWGMDDATVAAAIAEW